MEEPQKVTIDEIFDLIYQNYNEKPDPEVTKLILDFTVRVSHAYNITKK